MANSIYEVKELLIARVLPSLLELSWQEPSSWLVLF
jgi:hypothetical protein